jgi:hypothetical protein
LSDRISSRPTQRDAADIESTRGQIAWRDWLQWYGGSLIVLLALSFATAAIVRVHPLRCGFLYCALFFLAAAVDRPRAAFFMLRNTGWFVFVREDFVVRWIVLVMAIWMAGAGLFLPSHAFSDKSGPTTPATSTVPPNER